MASLATIFATSCNPTTGTSSPISEEPIISTIFQNDEVVSGSGHENDENYWAFKTYSLKAFAGKEVIIDFSADMEVENNSDSAAEIKWQLNISPEYPTIASHVFETGTSSYTVTGSNKNPVVLGADTQLYISTYSLDYSKIKITLKNVKYTVTAKNPKYLYENAKIWTDESVPSLYETYKDYFDYVGIACEYGINSSANGELSKSAVQKGLKKHANTITLGNEFKPQFICQWWNSTPSTNGSFTASNGVTIKTPQLKGLSNLDNILSICKKNNLKIRGHVLVWHSQTDDNFFCVDYNSNKSFVSKDVMTARQEWYIKTVVEYVTNWENKNNNGNHIVWAWDVVNEAVNDGSSSLRNNSNWYKIYGDDEFIVNAFRFANKYAPSDVLLCYNDYNCTDYSKRAGMVKVLKSILSHKDDKDLPTRIDAMGMQSHISVNTSTNSFQSALTDFLKLGIDVQITELDIATESNYKPSTLAQSYYNFFKLFIKNRKTDSNNGITAITIWGINDEVTWLNSKEQIVWHGNVKQYPLLFNLDSDGNYITKEAFDKVIEAAE